MATSVKASAKGLGKRPEVPAGFNPMSGARKIVIKNFRQSSTRAVDVEDYYRRTWADVEEAVKAILTGVRSRVPLERVYRGVEELCRHGEGKKVYGMLKQRCEEHLSREVLGKLREGGSMSDVDVLSRVWNQWSVFNKTLITVRSTFSFLDRSYVLNSKRLPSINDLLLSLYRNMVFGSEEGSDSSFGNLVISGLCRLVDHDRRGDAAANPTLMHNSINMLKVLGVYGSRFEGVFLSESDDYFHEFASDQSAHGLKFYISACDRLLKQEDARCNLFNFDSTTKVLLLDNAHTVLIRDYSSLLLNKGDVARLLEQNEVESMRALYMLLGLSKLQKKLKEPFESYILQAGSVVVNDVDKGDEMVVRLLDFRRTLDMMIRDAFGGDVTFTYGLRDAFVQFINDKKIASSWGTGTSKVGEMIAKHVDLLLRGGIKSLPKSLLSDNKDRSEAERSGQASTGDEDAELDRQLDQALELFRFIQGKDVFEAFYKKDLARRLLMNRSASQDAERNMLSKLKSECGSNFTHNLEQMFKDMELAKDEMTNYKAWLEGSGRDNGGVDLSVSILSQAAWPSYPDVKMLVPPDVAEKIDRFDAYYKNKHTGRKLIWKHNLAHCVVKATFPKGVKELLVSSMQAVVLVLFNQAPDGPLSTEQISTATGLQGGDLERTLQSLACAKIRPLVKAPKGKDIHPTDTFVVNKTFSDPKYRIKINQIQLKETKAENKETHERVAADRSFETQAAIVRIMKSRKIMAHAQLVAEVINQTKSRGAMDPADIKFNIEKLIEKEYIEREDGKYTYLA
ncbi:putative nuclear pore complex subunit Nup192 [Coniella lustricola]|uniref:Putative nuclear pore complex subunit Nup192 n=1 Tax=Coniella lustricola TaxID=2025994 RepID=A0A2T2ZVY1_9PEZI|nr:putative nuclear pore complex subunit Nup192 [Coniella lustricola]